MNHKDIQELAAIHVLYIGDDMAINEMGIDFKVVFRHPETGDLTWNIDRDNPRFVASLAKILVKLHRIPIQEAESIGVKSLTPELIRQKMLKNIECVKRELGVGAAMDFIEYLPSAQAWMSTSLLPRRCLDYLDKRLVGSGFCFHQRALLHNGGLPKIPKCAVDQHYRSQKTWDKQRKHRNRISKRIFGDHQSQSDGHDSS